MTASSLGAIMRLWRSDLGRSVKWREKGSSQWHREPKWQGLRTSCLRSDLPAARFSQAKPIARD